MVDSKKIKTFVRSKVLGAFFLAASLATFISLLTYSSGDVGFGFNETGNTINNYLGGIGAYYSSFLLVFLNYTSYLIVVFLGINGFKLLVKGFDRAIYIRLFFFVAGLLLLNLAIELHGVKFSLCGNILKSIIFSYLNEFYNLKYSKGFSLFVFVFLGIYLILISINIKSILIASASYNVLRLFLFPLRKITKILFSNKITKAKQLNRKFDKKNYKKHEPTINKNKKNIIKNTEKNSSKHDSQVYSKYELPSVELLKTSNTKSRSNKETEKRNLSLSNKLEETLKEYGVEGQIINYKTGPVVTLFEFIPAAGIKTSKIVGLSNDIARAMSSLSTRIAAQPGKTSIGIEIPNKIREDVLLGDLISSDEFLQNSSGLILALGKNISGEKKFTDLEKMPHLLIAGTTGSGKSVGINSMIISLLYNFTPSECKLILIDPKMLELSIYEDIPHLLTPVVTNPQKAVFALKWVVREMENRYKLMSSLNVKNIKSFNDKILNAKSNGRKLYREVQTGIDKDTRTPIIEKKEIDLIKMPLIVVVIDEMADLMMVAGKEVESLVQRLAQMARASGIHIIAATQRPSVDVITGTIKANFPSRISFRVASRFDSRTILNEMGAEQLLGSGDMLFLENGSNLNRLHGGFISESEIESIVKHIKSQKTNESQEDITIDNPLQSDKKLDLGFEEKNVDELYEKAIDIIIKQQKVSTSFIQRYLQIGYNRAARIIEKMEEDGYITEASHSGKRSVIKKNK